MISGVPRVLFLALTLLPAWSWSQGWGLAELMQEMAQVQSRQSRFVETRHVAMLTRPLELKGSLTYERPNRLSKHVEWPFDETLTVDGDALRLVNRTKGEQRSVSLKEQPALRALVESVRATLAGDGAQLERHYQVQFSGKESAWQLRLVPRDPKLRSFVEWVTMTGAGTRVQRIETLEGAGDRSVMTILHDGK